VKEREKFLMQITNGKEYIDFLERADPNYGSFKWLKCSYISPKP
jgi:hypothetical protein